MNVTQARKLAKDATRYGYVNHGATVAATCPLCRKHVTTDYHLWAADSKGRQMSSIDQARRGVFEHLQWNCDDTTQLFTGTYR